MTCRRTAVADYCRGSVEIQAGHKVVVSFTSATRDEAVFADPDRLAIRRHPNPHLGFGHGPPFCLGAHLARVRMRALFTEVMTRMGHLEYDGKPACLHSNFQRGVKRLPLRWWRRGGSR
jgi:cytochrome P450